MIPDGKRFHIDFPHLHLRDWPFQTVPDERFSNVWADRRKVMEQVNRLFWQWTRVNRSTIHLIWADLGAGKTHTLKYIQRRCLEQPDLGILPVYAVMPKQIKNFLEVYQAILAGLDLDIFSELFSRAYRAAGTRKAVAIDLFPQIHEAASVLLTFQLDPDRRELAGEWFRGGRLDRSDLKVLGVKRHVKTTDDAVALLGGLSRLVQITEAYRRVVVMLDECQRIGRFRLSIGRDINTGLQTWYDSSPNHLTLVLSFGSGDEQLVRGLLSPELQSREDHLRVSMPLLSNEEAVEFVGDLLDYFRTAGPVPPWFPFSESVVRGVVSHLTRAMGATPRALMKAFDAMLTEADIQISDHGEYQADLADALRLVQGPLRQSESEAED